MSGDEIVLSVFCICLAIVILTVSTYIYKGTLYEEEQDQITIRKMVDKGYEAMDIRCSWFYSDRWEAPCAIHAMKGSNNE